MKDGRGHKTNSAQETQLIELMADSPGNGKTLLARALLGILPEMSIEESLDVTRI